MADAAAHPGGGPPPPKHPGDGPHKGHYDTEEKEPFFKNRCLRCAEARHCENWWDCDRMCHLCRSYDHMGQRCPSASKYFYKRNIRIAKRVDKKAGAAKTAENVRNGPQRTLADTIAGKSSSINWDPRLQFLSEFVSEFVPQVLDYALQSQSPASGMTGPPANPVAQADPGRAQQAAQTSPNHPQQIAPAERQGNARGGAHVSPCGGAQVDTRGGVQANPGRGDQNFRGWGRGAQSFGGRGGQPFGRGTPNYGARGASGFGGRGQSFGGRGGRFSGGRGAPPFSGRGVPASHGLGGPRGRGGFGNRGGSQNFNHPPAQPAAPAQPVPSAADTTGSDTEMGGTRSWREIEEERLNAVLDDLMARRDKQLAIDNMLDRLSDGSDDSEGEK
ncbi:hypothetical protein IWZ01DRAFT_560906 [Phyllosticta capitalensis]